MKEEVLIPGLEGGGRGGLREPSLEGLLEIPQGEVKGGVVIAHPHPLYGGTMLQPVVHHTARACREAGLATLRFNFRGVGRSEGAYAGFEERKDVRAAFAFLQQRLGPARAVVLSGYSFGAIMSALAVVDGERPAGLALIAFAVKWDEFMPGFFSRLSQYQGAVLAVCGEKDEFAPPAEVDRFLKGLSPRLELVVIPEADHYFMRQQNRVGEAVAGFANECTASGLRLQR